MKYTQISQFKNEINPDSSALFFMILSKENFERQEIITHIIHILKIEKESLTSFQGAHVSPENLSAELSSMGLFASRRCIVIRDADKLQKNTLPILLKFLEKPAPDIFVILEAEAFNRNTNFYKAVEASGMMLDVPELKPKDKIATLLGVLREKAAAQGKTIDPQVCNLMINQLGTDQALLHNELEKVICYVGERKMIHADDIRAICGSVPQETIWQFGDALFKRDAPTALKILHGLLSDGTHFLSLLRQIRSQFQTKYQVCSILASGGSFADITKQYPYMKGFILDTHVRMAQGYGLESFKKAMITIDEAELAAKNSQTSPELAAEMLVIKLTS
jgi:DNA polymerase-3 subunit delta